MPTKLKLTENFFNIEKSKQSEKNTIANNIDNTFIENTRNNYTAQKIRNDAKQILKEKQGILNNLLKNTTQSSKSLDEIFSSSNIPLEQKEILNDMTFFADKVHVCRELELLYFGRVTPKKLDNAGLYKDCGNSLLLQATNAFVNRRDKESQKVTLTAMSHKNPLWDAFVGKTLSNTAKEHIKINLCSLHDNLPQNFMNYLEKRGYNIQSNKIKNISNELQSLQTESDKVFSSSRSKLGHLVQLKKTENIKLIKENKEQVENFADIISKKIDKQTINANQIKKLQRQLKKISDQLDIIEGTIRTHVDLLDSEKKLSDFTKVKEEIRTQFSIDCKEQESIEKATISLKGLHKETKDQIKSLKLAQQRLAVSIEKDLSQFNKILQNIGATQVSIKSFKKEQFLQIETDYVKELDNIINELTSTINADSIRVPVRRVKAFLYAICTFWRSPSTLFGGIIGGISTPIAMYTIGASIACCFAGGFIGTFIGIVIAHLLTTQDAHIEYCKDELSATHAIENIVHVQKEMEQFLKSEKENYNSSEEEVTNQNNALKSIEDRFNEIMEGKDNFKKMAEDFIKSFGTMNNPELQEKIIRNHFSDNQVVATIICNLVTIAFKSTLETYQNSKKAQYKKLPKKIFDYIDKYIAIKHNDSKDDDLLSGGKILTALIINNQEISKCTSEVSKALKSSISSDISKIELISETSFSNNTNCEELNTMANILSKQKGELIEERNNLFIKMANVSINDKGLRELMGFTTNLETKNVKEQIESINKRIINYNKKTSEFEKYLGQVIQYTKHYNKYKAERSVYDDNCKIANNLGIVIKKLEQVSISDKAVTLNNVNNLILDINNTTKSIQKENIAISKSIENKINELMKSLPDELHKELETVLKGNSKIVASESAQSASKQETMDNITKYFTGLFDNEETRQYLPLISKLYESNSNQLVRNKMVIDAEYITNQLNQQFPLFSFDAEKIKSTFKAFDEYMRIKLIINASVEDAQLKDMLSKIEENITPNSITYHEVIKSGTIPKLLQTITPKGVPDSTKKVPDIPVKTENNGQLTFQPSFINSSGSFDSYSTNEIKQDVKSISFKDVFNTLETATDYDSFKEARTKLIGNTNSIDKTVLEQLTHDKIKEMFCQLFTSISSQATLDGIKSGYKIPSISSVQYFIRAIILLLQELNVKSVKDTGTTIDTKLDEFQHMQNVSYKEDVSSFVKMIKDSIEQYTGSPAKGLENDYRENLQKKNVKSLNEISNTFEKMMEFIEYIYSPSTENKELLESIRGAYEKIQFEELNVDFFTKQQEEVRSIVYFEENALWNDYILKSNNTKFSSYCAINKIKLQEVKYTDRAKFKLPKEQWQLVFSGIESNGFSKKEYTFQEIQQYIPLDIIKKITLKHPQYHLDFERMIASWANELNVETLLKDEDSLRITLNRVSMLLMTINSTTDSTKQGKGLENSNLSQKSLQCAITAFKKDVEIYLTEASNKKLFSYNEQILINYLHNLLILIKTHSELDSTPNKPIACHVENKKLKYVKTSGIVSVNSAEIIEKIIKHIPNFEKLDIQSTVDDNVANFVYNDTEQSDYGITFFKQLNEYININTCRELSQCDSTVALNKLNNMPDIQNYAINISFRLAVLMKKKHFLEDSKAMKESFINDKLEKIFPSKKIKEYIDQLLSNKKDKGFSTPVLINLLTLIPLLTKKIFLASDNTLKFDFTKINNTKLSKLQLEDVSHRTVNDDMINGILFQVLSKDDILRTEDTVMYNRFIQSMYISYIIERLKFNEVKVELTESKTDKNVKKTA